MKSPNLHTKQKTPAIKTTTSVEDGFHHHILQNQNKYWFKVVCLDVPSKVLYKN